jgi:hypothetical protein
MKPTPLLHRLSSRTALGLAAGLALAAAATPSRATDIDPPTTDRVAEVGMLTSLIQTSDEPQPHVDELLAIARSVLETDTPCPHGRAPNGALDPNRMSPEFAAWAEAEGLDPEEELRWFRDGVSRLLAAMVTLGTPAAIEILEQALDTGHCALAPMAAADLAFVGDPRHVDRIEAAAAGQPAEIVRGLALALMLYRTPEAEAAVLRLIGEEGIEARMESD